MLRKFALSLFGITLIGLGLSIAAIPFNKYEWAASPIIDCDQDTELVVIAALTLLWMSSTLYLVWYVRSKVRFTNILETVILAIALLTSISVGPRYFELAAYTAHLENLCGSIKNR